MIHLQLLYSDMDILYVIGKGSNWNNNELRFSLRSLERYGKGVGRVFIIGPARPHFLSSNIVFIEHQDRFKYPSHNVIDCLMHVAWHTDISDDFLFSADDHFLCKDTDFDHFPIFRKGNLPQNPNAPKTYPSPGYWRILHNTYCLLRKYNLPTTNFAQHCNTHFNKSVFKAMRPIFEAAFVYDGVEPSCIMMNGYIWYRSLLASYNEIHKWVFENVMNRIDIKLHGAVPPNLLSLTGVSGTFSISDESIALGVADFLREQFPKPSRYEQV